MTDLIDHLDDALQALLAARVAAGGAEPCPLPHTALDDALTGDLAYQDARVAFRLALDSGSVLEVEAAHHQGVATAVGTGWLVATSALGRANGKGVQ
jgi:hypothetical protein